jgi:hypothetical protein
MQAKMPEGGLFFHEGEAMVLYPFLAYEVGPGTLSYHVNDANLSSIAFGHQHFNVSAPKATVLAEKTGDLTPFVGPSSQANPQPIDIAVTIPPDAVYVVAELMGTAATPGHLDADLALRSGTTDVGSSTGPTAHEVVTLGPTALAKARDLTAHITSTGPKGTYALKVTAYGPS